MKIGTVTIEGITALAPMAGVTDLPMRELCRALGASYVVGEMVSTKGMYYGDRKSAALLALSPQERPAAVQLFGGEPEVMAAGVKKALLVAPDVIDINMGCPAPKIVSSGGGSALMKNLPLAGAIIAAVVKASTVPVTVKMRTGWDTQHKNVVELAKMAEAAGAAAITVHGRTREQFYSGGVDYESIAAVVAAVKIPVIGNGDVVDIPSAKRMLETGVKLLMIGRGALGNPWIFGELEAYFRDKSILTPPTFETRMETLYRQVAQMVQVKGEYIAIREARKHAAWYLKGIPGAPGFRKKAGEICSLEDLERLCESALKAAEGIIQ